MTLITILFAVTFNHANSEVESKAIRQVVEDHINQNYQFHSEEFGVSPLVHSEAKMTIAAYQEGPPQTMIIQTIAYLETYDSEFGDPVSEVDLVCKTRIEKRERKWIALKTSCEDSFYGKRFKKSILSNTPISKQQAVQIARDYAATLGPDILLYLETTIEDQIDSVWFERDGLYYFVLYDLSGDCGFTIAVKITDGTIDRENTDSKWQCL